MKITKITPYLFSPGTVKNLLLVRVDTDEGIYGWGECMTCPRKEHVLLTYVEQMAPYLIGRSPFNIRHMWRVLFDDFGIRRSTLDMSSAWSGIEIALWDIVGKAAGLPLYKLLGGQNREKIRVYANGWNVGCKNIDEICDAAVKVVKKGFSALKWDPYEGPWRTYISRKEEDKAIANLKALREAVGPDVDILIDAHRRVAPNQAVSGLKRMEEFNILQFEDPNLADNIELVAETRSRTDIPIVTGETLFTKEQFLGVFKNRAADIINPDIGAIGGILPMLEIASMAEPHAVSVSPHNHNTMLVGLAATLHTAAVIPNFLISEYFVNQEEPSADIAVKPIEVKNGWIELPAEPGLGIDVKVERLLARPYEQLSKPALPDYTMEFPREGFV